MADVNFASIIRQNLFHMKNSDLPWKERAFRLWSACWRFVLESRDVCAFYLRYYYSANCRKYAYEEHLQYFQELIAMTAPAFRPETNAYMVVHQMFDTMLSFARCSGFSFSYTDIRTEYAVQGCALPEDRVLPLEQTLLAEGTSAKTAMAVFDIYLTSHMNLSAVIVFVTPS